MYLNTANKTHLKNPIQKSKDNKYSIKSLAFDILFISNCIREFYKDRIKLNIIANKDFVLE